MSHRVSGNLRILRRQRTAEHALNKLPYVENVRGRRPISPSDDPGRSSPVLDLHGRRFVDSWWIGRRRAVHSQPKRAHNESRRNNRFDERFGVQQVHGNLLIKGPQGRRRIPNALPNLVFKAWRLMVTKLIRIHIGEPIPQRFATNCRERKNAGSVASHQINSPKFRARERK
jgi:hypothetical protein